MLRGCCGLGDAVGHGWSSMMGAAVPTPRRAQWQVAMAVGGHGGRTRDTVGTVGNRRARRWICNVGGGRGSRVVARLALALPAAWGMGRNRGVAAEEEE